MARRDQYPPISGNHIVFHNFAWQVTSTCSMTFISHSTADRWLFIHVFMTILEGSHLFLYAIRLKVVECPCHVWSIAAIAMFFLTQSLYLQLPKIFQSFNSFNSISKKQIPSFLQVISPSRRTTSLSPKSSEFSSKSLPISAFLWLFLWFSMVLLPISQSVPMFSRYPLIYSLSRRSQIFASAWLLTSMVPGQSTLLSFCFPMDGAQL